MSTYNTTTISYWMLITRRQPRNHRGKDSRKAEQERGRGKKERESESESESKSERPRERERQRACSGVLFFFFKLFKRKDLWIESEDRWRERKRKEAILFTERKWGSKEGSFPLKPPGIHNLSFQPMAGSLVAWPGGRVRRYNHFMVSSSMGRLVSVLSFWFVASGCRALEDGWPDPLSIRRRTLCREALGTVT